MPLELLKQHYMAAIKDMLCEGKEAYDRRVVLKVALCSQKPLRTEGSGHTVCAQEWSIPVEWLVVSLCGSSSEAEKSKSVSSTVLGSLPASSRMFCCDLCSCLSHSSI